MIRSPSDLLSWVGNQEFVTDQQRKNNCVRSCLTDPVSNMINNIDSEPGNSSGLSVEQLDEDRRWFFLKVLYGRCIHSCQEGNSMGGPRRWDGKQGTLEQRTTETPGNTDTSNNQIQMHKYTWTSCDAAQYKRNNKQKISRLNNILWSNTHEDI